MIAWLDEWRAENGKRLVNRRAAGWHGWCRICHQFIHKEMFPVQWFPVCFVCLKTHPQEVYRIYMRGQFWRKKRAAKLSETGRACERCGVAECWENLHVHHKTYKNLLREHGRS
jgi:hypothetical protein